MEKRTIYCAGCDREVEVILRDGHEAASADPELAGAICLEAGRRCTGTSCPICAVRAKEGEEQETAGV